RVGQCCLKQTFEKPLEWKYPEDPQLEVPAQPSTPIEVRHPVPVSTVAVDCRESYVHVEVKKDMFGIGQFIYPGGLTLGDCPVSAEDNTGQVLIFQYELQSCGSELRVSLRNKQEQYGDSPVVRTSKAAVIVECHYPRQNVSSLPLDPLWVPFSAVKVAEGFLYFSLKLMTEDWVYERPSNQYFLGNVIHIEASVMQFFHVPLRVYVDHCVATAAPDVNSLPRYAFIDNHGCFVDGRVTQSASYFLPRTAENKLRFQLEAFRFQGVESGVMYVTCQLKATSTALNINELHRACSYVNNM
uniref:Zona pellucida sperm-binding protein 3 n=1 Tax=Periophthalmus magnuspinnatus TaxID=409849 RepID=A0A3B4ASK0_9GOBI